MKFDRAFRLYSYLLVLSGFLGLVASGAVSLVAAGLYLLAVLVAWKSRIRRLSSGVQLLLVGLMLVWSVADAILFSSLVQALTHLLLLISLVKLFSARSGRDYLLLYLVSFMFVLLASVHTISVFFLVTLGVFVFLSVLTFMLFETREAYNENRRATFSLRPYLLMSLVVTILVLLLAAPIFVLIPRGAMPMVGTDGDSFLQMTGFSDRVALGDLGRIMSDSRIVMRVKIDQDPEEIPSDLKWRGIALDYYDGRVWINSRRAEQQIYDSRQYGGYLVPRHRRQNESLLRQTFHLEPFSNIVFGAADILLVSSFGKGRSFILQDGNNSFTLLPSRPERLTYVVYSDVMTRGQRVAAARPGAPVPPSMAQYLQLPPISRDIWRLAAEVSKGSTTPIGRALAIERFLSRNYRYSLENESAAADDPLNDFLQRGKAGHCEYFAAAQAVLMRASGIPCRVVNGFRRGEYNSWNGAFVVRQSDAHSWVEGYFEGAGWVEFDATPTVVNNNFLFLSDLGREWIDALDAFWTELLTFDRIQQATLFRSAGQRLFQAALLAGSVSERTERLKVGFLDWTRRARLPNRWTALLGAGVVLLLLAVVLRCRRRLRFLFKRHVLGRSSDQLAPDYYREMLAVLERRGFTKKPAETALEFVERITPDLGDRVPARVTELYYRNRFGSQPLNGDQLSEIYESLRHLRKRWGHTSNDLVNT